MTNRRNSRPPRQMICLIGEALLLVCACVSYANSETISFPADGRYILAVGEGRRLLHPCSRQTPKHSSAYWEPTDRDIDKLERGLLPYLNSLAMNGAVLPPAQPYDRQYIGITQKGRRLIYINFFPIEFRAYDPLHEVIDICDGGPKHWGLLFDPKRRVFSDLFLNRS